MHRQLLVLQRSLAPVDLLTPLAARGWHVEVVTDIDRLLGDRSAQEVPLGLVVFDTPDAFDSAKVARLVSGVGEWIAVVSGPIDPRAPLARLVAEGFADYHTLPLDLERLLVILGHLAGKSELRRALRGPAGSDGQYGMTGTSDVMRALYHDIAKVARADIPVLISGERGTGKKLVARAVHDNSARSTRPFIRVSCGALPPALAAMEIFGYDQPNGQRVPGSIELAAGGTIVFDAIDEMHPDTQAQLLRFMQESAIVPAGSVKRIPIDVRVIATARGDLEEAGRQRRFREDLLSRLNVLSLTVPPVRERTGDVMLLADEVFHRFAGQKQPQVQGFGVAARAAMEGHEWPGNVEELITRVKKAMIMAEGVLISVADLGLAAPTRQEPRTSLLRARQSTERDAVLAALRRNDHNMTAAARDLGVSRVTLYRLMHRLEISRERSARYANLDAPGPEDMPSQPDKHDEPPNDSIERVRPADADK